MSRWVLGRESGCRPSTAAKITRRAPTPGHWVHAAKTGLADSGSRVAAALQDRIERQLSSLFVEPQEIKAFFAAQFGPEYQPVRTRVAGEPVGVESLWGREAGYLIRAPPGLAMSSTTTACSWPTGISQ